MAKLHVVENAAQKQIVKIKEIRRRVVQMVYETPAAVQATNAVDWNVDVLHEIQSESKGATKRRWEAERLHWE